MTAFPTVGDWRWAGKPALNIGTGGDTHPTRKFGIFFYLEAPNLGFYYYQISPHVARRELYQHGYHPYP
ncbi:hypothetical protein NIES4073_69510 [Kalymmatonema gypsitolerans NIES-4073]|nr:hypothetical protein NIES4073_69510 [Scytonema sp. NIES-4073]